MTPSAIDKEIETMAAGQQKLAEKMAAAKAKRREREKAAKQKLERQIGRLAMQFDLHLLSQEELVAVFQNAQPNIEDPQHAPHASDETDRDSTLKTEVLRTP